MLLAEGHILMALLEVSCKGGKGVGSIGDVWDEVGGGLGFGD